MAVELSCPWCQRKQAYRAGVPNWCSRCSHRVDREKHECDCLMCEHSEALFPLPEIPPAVDVTIFPVLNTASQFAQQQIASTQGTIVRVPGGGSFQVFTTVQLDTLCVSVWEQAYERFACEVFLSFPDLLRIMPAVLASMNTEQRAAMFLMLEESE